MAPAQLAEWFGDPELARQKAMPRAAAGGGYRKWAWFATIAMGFLNMGNIFSGRILPLVIGLAFLWLPASLADKISAKDD